MAYKPYSREQKQEYAKKFSDIERKAYLAGKRQGFLEGVHKPPLKKKSEFISHDYLGIDLNKELFDDIDKVDIFKRR